MRGPGPTTLGTHSCASRLKEGASTKVVLMSGRASEPEFRHDAAERFKADGILAKPLAAADVLEICLLYTSPSPRD